MKPERWQQVEHLYHAALEHAPDERTAFLDEACGGDRSVRQEVESLLAYDERAAHFITTPPDELAAAMLAEAPTAVSPARIRVALVPRPGMQLCSKVTQAQSLANEIAQRYPKATLNNEVYLPVVRAAIELQRGNADRAIELLRVTSPYEGMALFWPNQLRGQAYLRSGKGAEAAAEFQQILDHRGWDAVSAFYPLAHLGLARAAALTGDVDKSRKAYQDFFALWKDADPDLPILIEAKREYQRLDTRGATTANK